MGRFISQRDESHKSKDRLRCQEKEELVNIESSNARLREEVERYQREQVELDGELEQQDRRIRRQERDRQEWDAQESAIRNCEDRLATLSEICTARRLSNRCAQRSPTPPMRTPISPLPRTQTVSAGEKGLTKDGEVLVRLAEALRELGCHPRIFGH